ncbi:MAG TPA: SDR family NAD(P)-dependent oxidoreductase, partial [Pirellulales bacterium]
MDHKPTGSAVEIQPKQETLLGRFAGKAVLVTGASDRGIGGAIAERLAREGAKVTLLSRTEPKRLIKRLARLPAGALWTKCDVTKNSDVKRSVQQAKDHFGRIDVLINNAG